MGEVINLIDEERDLKLPAIITGIESFEYEFVDLIVNYRVELIQPWTEKQMSEAIQENRLSTFKILEGNKE